MRYLKKYNFIWALPVIAIYVYTRWKYLGEISYYMHVDEMKAAFDSMVLAGYGSDSFDKLPSLYVLLGALLMKLKGGLFSLKLFRLISVAGGLFCMIFSSLSVKEITGKERYAFLEAVLITTLPFFFISGRTGVSDYLLVEIAPAAFYFLIKGIKSTKKYFLIISGILFGVLLFTTEYAYLFVLLFMYMTLIYLLFIRKMCVSDAARTLAGFSVPFVVFLLVCHKSAGFDFSNVTDNFMNIKALFWDDGHPFNISSSFGAIYSFSVPIALIGVVSSVKHVISSVRKKYYDVHVVIWLFIIASFVSDLLIEGADIQKGNVMFFSVSLILIEGLMFVAENLKGALAIEVIVYLVCFWFFTGYYYENFNSEVNNSTDHEMGIVVDKSVGEAIKASIKLMPDRTVHVVTDNFTGRNLMVALFAGTSCGEYEDFKDKDSFEAGRISVGSQMDDTADAGCVYVINEAEYGDIALSLAAQGWGCIYLKEYTVCFMQ